MRRIVRGIGRVYKGEAPEQARVATVESHEGKSQSSVNERNHA